MKKLLGDLSMEQKWWFDHYVMDSSVGRLGNIVFFDAYLTSDVEVRKVIARVFLKKYHKRNPMRNPLARWWMAHKWVGLLRLYRKNSGQKPCPFMGTYAIYGITDEDFLVAEQILISDCITDFIGSQISSLILSFFVTSGVSAIAVIGFFLVEAYSVAASIIIVNSFIALFMSRFLDADKKHLKENDEMTAFLFNLLESAKSPLWWLTQNVPENS